MMHMRSITQHSTALCSLWFIPSTPLHAREDYVCQLLKGQGPRLASQWKKLLRSPLTIATAHAAYTGVRLPQVTAGITSRQLKQVIGCVNCGSNNGNNNGAQVSVSQSVSQTSGGGGGGGGLPFLIPGVPIIGHKRLMKQVVGCVNCGSGNGNGNGASVGVSQSVTQTNQAGGSDNPFPFSFPISIPLGRGHRRMLKQCVDNFASCQSWGRSQCKYPGVVDRCPCMCTDTQYAAGTQPGPVVTDWECAWAAACDIHVAMNHGNNNGAGVGVSQAAGK
jgi:hypothetical protein